MTGQFAPKWRALGRLIDAASARWAGRLIRRPRTILVICGALLASIAAGLSNIEFDDRMSEFFRAETSVFREYETFGRQFTTSERDVLIVVSSPNELDRDSFERLRWLHLEFVAIDGVAGVYSPFTLRTSPDAQFRTDPLVPLDLPEGAAFGALLDRLATAQSGMPPTISRDKLHLLLIVSLGTAEEKAYGPAFIRIRDLVEKWDSSKGVRLMMTGIPAIRDDIRRAVQRDTVIFNVIGFLLAFAIGYFAFRSFGYTLLAAIPALYAVVIIVGGQAWLGVPITMITAVVPTLVLIVIFNDATHLVFEIRERFGRGEAAGTAVVDAIATVGPPCLLSSLITAASIATLIPTSSAMVRDFGWVTSLAMLAGLGSLFVILPPLAVLTIARIGRSQQVADPVIGALERFSFRIATWVARFPRIIAVVGIALTAIAVFGYDQLQPTFRISTYVPRPTDTLEAMRLVDRSFGGINEIAILVDDRSDRDDGLLTRALEASRIVGQAVVEAGGVEYVFSLDTIANWAAERVPGDPDRLAEALKQIPAPILLRIVTPDQRTTIVSFRLRDLQAAEISQILQRISDKIDLLSRADRAWSFRIAGFSALTASQSESMIQELRANILQTFAIAIVLLGIFFFSVRVMLVVIPSFFFPLLIVASGLVISGRGLEFAGAIGLTVGLGIAVDNTIHLVHRWQLVARQGGGATDILQRVLHQIGPVVILTTASVVAGLAVTVTSSLPAIVTFGAVLISVLVLALFSELFMLPALMILIFRSRQSDIRNA